MSVTHRERLKSADGLVSIPAWLHWRCSRRFRTGESLVGNGETEVLIHISPASFSSFTETSTSSKPAQEGADIFLQGRAFGHTVDV